MDNKENMTPKERSLANLKPPWPKGQSGNKKGRKKGAYGFKNRLIKMLESKNPEKFEKQTGFKFGDKTKARLEKVKIIDAFFGRIIMDALNGDKDAQNKLLIMLPELKEETLNLNIGGQEEGEPVKVQSGYDEEYTEQVLGVLERAGYIVPGIEKDSSTEAK